MTRAAMQQALDALESRCGTNADERQPSGAIAALRAALAEPQAEPVAWRFAASFWANLKNVPNDLRPHLTPLYAAPPQRQPLTPLTDEQIDADWREACRMNELTRDMVRAFAKTVINRSNGIGSET